MPASWLKAAWRGLNLAVISVAVTSEGLDEAFLSHDSHCYDDGHIVLKKRVHSGLEVGAEGQVVVIGQGQTDQMHIRIQLRERAYLAL